MIEVLVVVAITGVVAVIAVPMMANTLGFYRLSGDARGVSNATAVAKMRAASEFTRVRLRANLTSRTHRLETWDKATCTWAPQGGATALSSNVNFGFGSIGTAPPNTQATIGQASACTSNPPSCSDNTVTNIADTACIMFNSRGVPVDSTFAPTASDAIYVTDGTAVYGLTIAATGMIRTWRTGIGSTNWVLN